MMKHLLSFFGVAALTLGGAALQAAENPLYAIPVKTITGESTTLTRYAGDVLLVVNVASRCGNTPQYAALEALFQQYGAQGFQVLGFPSGQFANQELATNAEIAEFCSREYGVTFPMFEKIAVNGPERHPLYVALAGETSPFPGDITWNFAKFLVGRDGTILARFAPGMQPNSAFIITSIEKALGKRTGSRDARAPSASEG